MALFGWRNKAKTDTPTKEMSFFDHLEELRWHLFRMALAVMAFAIALFIYREAIIGAVFRSPFFGDFPTHKFLCQYLSDEFCFVEVPVKWQAISPYEQFMKALSYSFFGGIILAFPYLVWELWRFIRPGLTEKEVKAVRWNVAVISLLFFIGVFFGYFVILPFSIKFFSDFALIDGITNDWRIGEVISFILTLVFGTGFIFQLPVITYYLTKIRILNSAFLRKYRRHAIVIILIIAAFITPPDPISQILVGIPLIILFEIGIFIAKRVEKRRPAED